MSLSVTSSGTGPKPAGCSALVNLQSHSSSVLLFPPHLTSVTSISVPCHTEGDRGSRRTLHLPKITQAELWDPVQGSAPAPPSFPYVRLHVSPDPVCKVLSFMPGDSPQAGVEGSCSPEASAAISACAAPSAGSPGRWSVPSSLGAGCGRRRQSAEAAPGQRSHSSAGQRWGH